MVRRGSGIQGPRVTRPRRYSWLALPTAALPSATGCSSPIAPAAFAPGTKMSFAGLSKPEDRANVIAFLKSKGGGPDYPAPAAPAAAEGAEGEAPAAGVEGGDVNPVEAAGAMGDEQPVADGSAAVGNASQE